MFVLSLNFKPLISGVLKRKPSPCWHFTMVLAIVLGSQSQSTHPYVVCRHFSCLLSLFQDHVACRILPKQGLSTDARMNSRQNLFCLFWAIWRTVLFMFVNFSWLLQTEQVKASKKLNRSCKGKKKKIRHQSILGDLKNAFCTCYFSVHNVEYFHCTAFSKFNIYREYYSCSLLLSEHQIHIRWCFTWF